MITDEATFKKHIVVALANQLTLHIDRLITHSKLSFTQKQAIENMRESGVMNAIILGDFSKLSVDKLIELFMIFDLGISIHLLSKESYAIECIDTLRKH
jgi:hypothetical protein